MPPGPDPRRWGTEEGVRELLGERIASLLALREAYVERAEERPAACPAEYVPSVATLAS